MAAIGELEAVGMSRPLLIVDGDSFAHRSYHALPKSIRRTDGGPAGLSTASATCSSGSGRRSRRAPSSSRGTRLPSRPTVTPPSRATRAGAEFERDLLEQLDLAPAALEAMGFAVAKADGYEADDFLAAAVAFEEARGGSALVASGDRDTFQLASERTTILQPQRGGGAFVRIGPAEVRERYGVDPEQVPDFIALRGDPSDRIPGARGVGPKTAADILARYRSLEEALAAGRFEREAEALRLYRRVATMDAAAPLPAVPEGRPTWGRAAELASDWGLGRLAERLRTLEASSSS